MTSTSTKLICRSLVITVLDKGIMTNMGQETALWINEIPCTRAPPNSPRTMAGGLVRITSLEAPARITSLEAPAEKQGTIVGTAEAKAMDAVIVTLVIVLVLGVPAVIVLGVPANIKGVMTTRGVSTDGNFVNPYHLPLRQINGLKDLDPPFPKAYV